MKENELTVVQQMIVDVCESIKDMLLEKNRKYGNAALDPLRIFSVADPVEQIRIRIDDKLSRIMEEDGEEDEDVVSDLIGYLVLLKVAEHLDDPLGDCEGCDCRECGEDGCYCCCECCHDDIDDEDADCGEDDYADDDEDYEDEADEDEYDAEKPAKPSMPPLFSKTTVYATVDTKGGKLGKILEKLKSNKKLTKTDIKQLNDVFEKLSEEFKKSN